MKISFHTLLIAGVNARMLLSQIKILSIGSCTPRLRPTLRGSPEENRKGGTAEPGT